MPGMHHWHAPSLAQENICDPRGEEDDHAHDNEYGDHAPQDLGDFLGTAMKKKTHTIDDRIISYGRIFAKD